MSSTEVKTTSWAEEYLRMLIRGARIRIVRVTTPHARQPRIDEAETKRFIQRLRDNPHTRFVVK